MTFPRNRTLAAVALLLLAAVWWWSVGEKQPDEAQSTVSKVTKEVDATLAARPLRPVDRFAAGKVLAERERPIPGLAGRFQRQRLVRSDFKYPLLRVDEVISRVSGSDELLERQTAYVADHVMVKVRPGVDEKRLVQALARFGAAVRDRKPASGLWLVSFTDAGLDTVPRVLAEIARAGDLVHVAEPDYIVHASVLPNDASFGQLWGLHNTGQSGGTADADIDAPEAWELSTGSRAVLVGVIDTGIDHTHPDLVANMWTNPGEIASNGLDDDGNGYVDDTRGWDFANNDNNPMDDNNHGTHCAGTIGGVGNNGAGVTGVNWQVSLVGLKFLSASGSGATSDAVEATAYATSIGVDLTSNSWGGGGFTQSLKTEIDAADAAGILFVAAAGNETTDSDITPNYPSGYASPNIISVASTTRTDGLSSFSNYGATTVDLAAPGSEIYSTTPGNTYQSFSGTSMATPHVAGACALLKAYRDSLSHSEIKDLLMQSVDVVPALSGRCITGGRINLHKALLASGDLTTSPGGGLSASGPMGGPLTPNSITYTLTNRGTSNVAWSASADATWVSLSSSGEIVPPGGNSTLTVQLSEEVAALPGGRHTAHVTITNVTSSTSQTRLVELDILPPVAISEPLNDNPNWLTTGEWEFGTPTGQGGAEHGQPDPSTGASGANVYGVNLGGDYSITPGGPFYVTAGPFDLTLQDSTRLEFQRWLNTDMPNWVTATLEVSNNGSTWTQLFVNSGEIADSAWTPQSFDISAVADQQSQVWLRWGYQVKNLSDVWAYSGWNIDDIVIRGVPVNNIALVLPPDLTEGDAPVAATLVMTPVPSSPAVVTLVSADPAQLQVPASVTVPAGSASVPVLLTAVDDALADGTQTIGITASSAGYPDRQVSLAVHDNETRVITIALPASLSEGAGVVANAGTVSLDAPAGAAVRVFLESDDTGELRVPASVIIPAGQSSASFTLTAVDDTFIDGVQMVTVTGSVQGWTSGTDTIAITDNEALTLALTLPASVIEGQTTVFGSITLSGQAVSPITVSLTSSDSSEIAVPAGVSIGAGNSGITFPITVQNDAAADGPQNVTITASASGFSNGSGVVIVNDIDTPAMPASPQPAHAATSVHPESDLAWSTLPGSGGAPTSYDIYFGTTASPPFVVETTQTTYAMPRLNAATTYYWRVVAKNAVASASGPVWSFTTAAVGPVTRFGWSPISSPRFVDEQIPVTVTAYDQWDNIASGFSGSVTIKPVTNDATVLITEVNPNSPDEVEFVNVSTTAANIGGWIVSFYDNDTYPARKTFTIPTGTVVPAGGVFRVQEFGSYPGAYPLFRFGSNLNWTSDALSAVAVLLSKPDGTLVDFMCAGAASASAISLPAAIPLSQWTGAAISAPSNIDHAYTRFGNSDRSTAADWAGALPAPGVIFGGLTVPFPGSITPPQVLPTTSIFTAGVWSGHLQVRGPVAALQMRAEDSVGHRGDSNAFDVTGLGPLTLTTSAPAYPENAGTLANAVTITLPVPAPADVNVTLTSSDTSEAVVSAFTILAGQTSGSTSLQLINDALLDGSQSVTLSASAPGYTATQLDINVTDDETAVLSLSAVNSASEAAGTLTGTLNVSTPAGASIAVSLSSSDTSEISVPATVNVPAGQTSVTFPITVLQDALLDGPQNVVLTASVANWTSGTKTITITDDEVAAVTLNMISQTHEGAGQTNGGGVLTLGGIAVADVTVTLSSNDLSELTVPASVIIPAGQNSTAVPILAVEDVLLDGAQLVTISAIAFGNPAVTDSLQVRDNDAASLVVGTMPSSVREGAATSLTITARDVANQLITVPVGGPVTLSASGNAGANVVQPGVLSGFVNGVWTGQVRVMNADTNVRLTAASPTASGLGNAFTVTTGPRLAASPPSFSLNVPQQWQKTRTLTISNTGAEPLIWSAGLSGVEWLTVLPMNGTVPAGGSQNVTLTFDAHDLSPGGYAGSLALASNDERQPSVGVPVAMQVTPGVHHLRWSTIASPHAVNTPQSVTITAEDVANNVVADFDGSALLSLNLAGVISPPQTGAFVNGVWSGSIRVGSADTWQARAITAGGQEGFSNSFTTTGTGTLSLVMQSNAAENAGTITASVTRPVAPVSDLVIDLENLAPGIASVPLSVTMLAGQTQVSFSINVINDSLLDGTSVFTLRALAVDHTTASAVLNVLDDETTTVTVNLPASIAETAGAQAASVTLGRVADAELTLTLSSSLPARLSVPATVTIPAGSATASFSVQPIDNAIIDGTESVTVTATLAGSAPGSGTVDLLDNEQRLISLQSTRSSVSEGESPLAGVMSVTLPGTVSQPLVITLNSSDVSEVIVPASVTIPAGANSAFFELQPVNDTIYDGTQGVTITASAASFTSGTRLMTVQDDDVWSFVISPFGAVQTSGVPFNVTFTARDVNGVTITAYSGSPVLTATAGVTPLVMSPGVVSGFVNGSRTVSVIVHTAATGAVLKLTDLAGRSSQSGSFQVNAGALSQFAWSPISSPKLTGVSFPVTVTAQDAAGNTVTSFTSTAALETQPASAFSMTTSNFVAGVWNGNVTLASPATGLRLKATQGAVSGLSNVFDVSNPIYLGVVLLPNVVESAGSLLGSVMISPPQASPMTITISSSDASEAGTTTATIPAGNSSAPFTLPVVDDSIADGAQAVTITASAPGLISGSSVLSVRDDDLHHFSFAPVASPQFVTLPFQVTLNARTVDDMPATAFTGTAALSSSPSTLTPFTTGSFVNAAWTGNLTLADVTAVNTLTATSGAATGTSNGFEVAPNDVAAGFEWVIAPGVKTINQALPVTIRAITTAGYLAPSYSGSASLSLKQPASAQIVCGSDALNLSTPFATQQVMRCQSILTKEEIGGARTLTGLSLKVHTTSGQIFQNFTIRVKHVSAANHSSGTSWESTGLETVFSGSRSFSFTGWNDLNFVIPFFYNGSDNLLVDISYQNSSTGSVPQFRLSPDATRRMIYQSGALAALGDPLTWSGATPAATTNGAILQMRLLSDLLVQTSVGTTTPFVNGVWTGTVNVIEKHPAIVLEAVDGALRGHSEPVSFATAPPVMTAEPAFTGGSTNTVHFSATPFSDEVQADDDADFSSPVSQTSSGAGSATFSGLADGVLHRFRARSVNLAESGARIWSQRERADFTGNQFTQASAATMPGDAALAVVSTTDAVSVENFDQGDAVMSSTLFPTVVTTGAGVAEKVVTGGDYSARLTANASALATTVFTDGVIEAFITPETFTTGTLARVLLRASQAAPGALPSAYAAQVSFNSSQLATVDLVLISGGSVSSLSRVSLTSSSIATGESVKVRLTAAGPVLSVQAWKVAVGGAETALVLAGSQPVISVSDYHFASGVAGIQGAAGARLFFDDVTVTRKQRVHAASGSMIASVTPLSVASWGVLSYEVQGVGLTLDILDEDNNLLAANVASGTSLVALSMHNRLKLRANFTTTDTAVTPVLKSWSLAYQTHVSAPYGGAWSNVVTSTQDATPPQIVAKPWSASGPTAIISGTASDAVSGLASVTIDGTAATSPATWSGSVNGLVEGANTATIIASDSAMPPNTTTVTTTVYRIVNPHADADGNGHSALLEHALAIPSGTAAHALMPATAMQSDAGGKWLTMSYRRRVPHGGLVYTIQTSDDLVTWDSTQAAVTETGAVASGDGVTEIVSVRIAPAAGTIPRRFARLRVTIE